MKRRENAMMPPSRPIEIDPGLLADKKCPVCSGTVFLDGHKVKILPATHPQNPTGQEHLIRQSVAYCAECKTILIR